MSAFIGLHTSIKVGCFAFVKLAASVIAGLDCNRPTVADTLHGEYQATSLIYVISMILHGLLSVTLWVFSYTIFLHRYVVISFPPSRCLCWHGIWVVKASLLPQNASAYREDSICIINRSVATSPTRLAERRNKYKREKGRNRWKLRVEEERKDRKAGDCNPTPVRLLKNGPAEIADRLNTNWI